MSEIEEHPTTFIFFVQKYLGALRKSLRGVWTRSDTYLNVTTSIPIRAPTAISVWAVKQAFALLDSPVGDEYNFTSRHGTRKPLPIYYGPGSLDAQWCNCRQCSSQPSVSSAKYSNLTPTQTRARRGVRSKSKLSIELNLAPNDGVETQETSTVPCTFQSFAAHHGGVQSEALGGGVETHSCSEETSPVLYDSQSFAAHHGGVQSEAPDGVVETHPCSVETSPVPCDSQSFAAHYDTNNSWNQWPAGATHYDTNNFWNQWPAGAAHYDANSFWDQWPAGAEQVSGAYSA
ncbi:hypothetical protein K435DRAFT_848147 [Dendrothele bispora CBS 962.96]|uniref:Uncharacterized protein n=1 Tax=Dendrothele bispora (strain CBS 962.96) TaxID=1314807 RepID=A0A4S8MXB8_DENBC|nr:hypothetical protein K435DRAFT_848147 [Dendrothele bispora CBS 962.96]